MFSAPGSAPFAADQFLCDIDGHLTNFILDFDDRFVLLIFDFIAGIHHDLLRFFFALLRASRISLIASLFGFAHHFDRSSRASLRSVDYPIQFCHFLSAHSLLHREQTEYQTHVSSTHS
jgi:hypothetical protein